MPAARSDLGLAKRETLILAVIQTCNIERHDSLDMHYYKRQGAIEVVDITSVQCLVGRIKDQDWWAIIDRSGSLARATFDLD